MSYTTEVMVKLSFNYENEINLSESAVIADLLPQLSKLHLLNHLRFAPPYIPTSFITLIVPQSITMLLFCQKSFSTFTFTFICLGSPTDRTHKRISSLFCYGKTIKYPCRLHVKGNVIVNCHRQNENFQWIRTGKGNATRYYLRIPFMTMYNESMN